MTPEKLKQLKEHLESIYDEKKTIMSLHQKELADKAFRSLNTAVNGLSDSYKDRQALYDEIVRALTYLGEAGLYDP